MSKLNNKYVIVDDGEVHTEVFDTLEQAKEEVETWNLDNCDDLIIAKLTTISKVALKGIIWKDEPGV